MWAERIVLESQSPLEAGTIKLKKNSLWREQILRVAIPFRSGDNQTSIWIFKSLQDRKVAIPFRSGDNQTHTMSSGIIITRACRNPL